MPKRRAARTALFTLATLAFALQACQGLAPAPTPTATIPPTVTATATITPTVTPSPSPTFPPTYTPVFTPTPESLTSTITAQCDRAMGTKTAQDGKVELPLLALRKVVDDKQGWRLERRFPHLRTETISAARTLVCTRVTRTLIYRYNDGKVGYQSFVEVRVVHLPDGKVIFVESLTGEKPATFKVRGTDTYGPLPPSKLEKWLYDNAGDQSVIYNDYYTLYQPEKNTLRPSRFVSEMALSPDGKLLAIALLYNLTTKIRLWDLENNREAGQWELDDMIESLEFSPDGRSLAYSIIDGDVTPPQVTRIVDATTGQVRVNLPGENPIFSLDGQSIVIQDHDPSSLVGRIVRRDAVDGHEIQTLFSRSLSNQLLSLQDYAISPDGNTLVVYVSDILNPQKSTLVWDIPGAQVVATLEHPERVESVPFDEYGFVISPDGRRMASVDLGAVLSLWDLETKTRIRQINAFSADGPIGALADTLAFSPDGKYLAVGMRDSTVRVWDTTTLLEVHTLVGHISPTLKLAFSPDGRMLISASGDSTIKLWDLSAP